MNAFGGQSVPQLAQGFGVGKSPRSANSRYAPTATTPALNSSRSARLANRPDGKASTRYTKSSSANQTQTRPML